MKTKLQNLSNKFNSQKDKIGTEEATKNALVMPFISALGYDIFDPSEVQPEFIADVGMKKGEKVDYAILNNSELSFIIECKHWKENLDDHIGQLHRYYGVTKAKFGILTNGIEYWFYSDLMDTNKMDNTPFLIVNINNIKDSSIAELSRFSKDQYDETSIVSGASKMLYINQIVELFANEMASCSTDYAKHFATKILSGRRMTQSVVDTFQDLVPKAINQYINDRVNDRIKHAMIEEEDVEEIEVVQEPEDGIVTTQVELDGLAIVRAILSKHIDPSRIDIRDRKSYCNILLDNNGNRMIARMHFNNEDRLEFAIANRRERDEYGRIIYNHHPIENVQEIHQFANELETTLEDLLNEIK